MANFIVMAIIILLIALACFIIWKQKKNGGKCMSCSSGGGCSLCDKKQE